MKKLVILIVMLFSVFGLLGCDENEGDNYIPKEEIQSASLSTRNYDTFLNVSYTVSVSGPVYGQLGYNYYFTVNVSSMNPKYTFNNVEIIFDKESTTKFKLSSTGNSTFTLTYYQSTNNVAPTVKIKSISGYVSWVK